MTEDNDLVKRLRLKRERCHDLSGVYYTEDADCQAAADRIEALTKQLEAARLDAKEAEVYSVWLEAKLAKAVEAVDKAAALIEERHVVHMTAKGRNPKDYISEWSLIAKEVRATLAELTGGKDE